MDGGLIYSISLTEKRQISKIRSLSINHHNGNRAMLKQRKRYDRSRAHHQSKSFVAYRVERFVTLRNTRSRDSCGFGKGDEQGQWWIFDTLYQHAQRGRVVCECCGNKYTQIYASCSSVVKRFHWELASWSSSWPESVL